MLRTSQIVLRAMCCVLLLACESKPPVATETTDIPVDTGDARLRSGEPAPKYLDLVDADVSAADADNLRFVGHVAGPLRDDSPVPKGDAAIGWSFCVDTDAASAGVGFPMTGVRRCEFVVRVLWNGRKMRGYLIDRRPLMLGSYALIDVVEPTWRQSAIEVEIPLEELGNPDRFSWSLATEEFAIERPGASIDQTLRSETIHLVDEVPDGGISAAATWRSD